MQPSGVITITTDFGHKGPFVGVMKGVILQRFCGAKIVDLTHEISAYDLVAAGLALQAAVDPFPDGTVHLAVVDPGVGSSRRPIIVETRKGA